MFFSLIIQDASSPGPDGKILKRSAADLLLLRMLERYTTITGEIMVPKQFVIPRTVEWPEDMWDNKLGRKVEHIRQDNAYKSIREDLKAMGFSFDYTKRKSISKSSNSGHLNEEGGDESTESNPEKKQK